MKKKWLKNFQFDGRHEYKHPRKSMNFNKLNSKIPTHKKTHYKETFKDRESLKWQDGSDLLHTRSPNRIIGKSETSEARRQWSNTSKC